MPHQLYRPRLYPSLSRIGAPARAGRGVVLFTVTVGLAVARAALLWYQDHRQQQLDRRARQSVILEAARLGQSFDRQLALEPEFFQRLAGFRTEFFSQRRVRTEPVRKASTNG